MVRFYLPPEFMSFLKETKAAETLIYAVVFCTATRL